jgi:hypothetical protein
MGVTIRKISNIYTWSQENAGGAINPKKSAAGATGYCEISCLNQAVDGGGGYDYFDDEMVGQQRHLYGGEKTGRF